MMQTKPCNTEGAITLAEETISFGGMLLEYRLLVRNTYADRFRILITSGSERAEGGLGNEIGTALDCYRLVVDGRVTPCALEDVMYDLNRR